MLRRALLLYCAALVGAIGSFSLSACEEPPPGGTGGQGGTAGAGGCPMNPRPMFTLTISAAEGPVPPDTSLAVTWSAGPEPVFSLDDPDTWGTAEQGANVLCDLDPAKPLPADLQELVCRLWTSGPTEVQISAEGYEPHKQTLVPMQSEQCDGPVPADVAIRLMLASDAGTPP